MGCQRERASFMVARGMSHPRAWQAAGWEVECTTAGTAGLEWNVLRLGARQEEARSRRDRYDACITGKNLASHKEMQEKKRKLVSYFGSAEKFKSSCEVKHTHTHRKDKKKEN